MKNTIEFMVYGNMALFTDPLTKLGGEKFSYDIPPYQTLVGIVSSIYWKPTIRWVIDDIRIMNPIRRRAIRCKPIIDGKMHTICNYTYLEDCCYQVRAHFEWDESRPDLANDRNEGKHYEIAQRSVRKGGRYDVFLGTRECQAYVEPCRFGEGNGYYDNQNHNFDLMYHSILYDDNYTKTFWRPVMENGVIHFCRPEECVIKDTINKKKEE